MWCQPPTMLVNVCVCAVEGGTEFVRMSAPQCSRIRLDGRSILCVCTLWGAIHVCLNCKLLNAMQ